MLSTTSVKLATALFIFLCALISTICPLFVAGKSGVLFSAGNMMASGVLLSAGLVHQLANSSSSLDVKDGYPWSFLICGLTFILFLIFEESIHLLIGDHSHGDNVLPQLGGMEHKESTSYTHTNPAPRSFCQGSVVQEQILKSCETTDYGSTNVDHDDCHSFEVQPLTMSRASPVSTTDSSFTSIICSDLKRQSAAGAHHHNDGHIAEHLHGSSLASMMLLGALSVHSILEGLPIGLAPDVNQTFTTAIAIVSHKGFAGYALGSTMVAADLGWSLHVPLGISFSFSTPLGILVGMALASRDSYNEDSASIGIVQAIVAGTFLYIAIVEVGMKELLVVRQEGNERKILSLSQKQTEALKLFSLLLGFLAMSVLAKYI